MMMIVNQGMTLLNKELLGSLNETPANLGKPLQCKQED